MSASEVSATAHSGPVSTVTPEKAEGAGIVGDDTARSRPAPTARNAMVAALAYVWLRVALIVSMSPFETPDTASYRSGQDTRPPISSFLFSALSDRPYVVLSAVASSAGFVALVWALWDPQRRRLSWLMTATVALVSLLPLVGVYEHWLVPDSLLVGLALLALSLAWKPIDQGWYPWVLGLLCLLMTLTKEVGFGVVLLVGLVAALRHSIRLGLLIIATCAVAFATVVLPASSRAGTVLWEQPADSELTMERFRLVVGGLLWTDLSPELGEVGRLAADCGMTRAQLFAETFQLTDEMVGFGDCSELWEATDRLSQVDVLVAHMENPKYVGSSIERGFAADMNAMAMWSGYSFTQPSLLVLDRVIAGIVALVPLLTFVAALAVRRGRLIGLIGVFALAMALVAALVDPSSQDRHTIVFRIAAFAIGLVTVSEIVRPAPDGNEPSRAANDDLSDPVEQSVIAASDV